MFIGNRLLFDKLINSSFKIKNELNKIKILHKAAKLASTGMVGIFNSRKIEDQLIEISQKHHCTISGNIVRNSFLHVFTQCYTTGGHTRVCERWIKYSPSNEMHSIAFINQKSIDIPTNLNNYVKEKKGSLFFLNGNYLDKAIKLREIASSFDKIILHVNMEDVVPILAFGNKSFKRPIIFFNHADHLFWLGVSISDIVVNLRTISKEINIKCRDALNNLTIPLPVDKPKSQDRNLEKINKTKLELDFPISSKIIITMASSYKYLPFDSYNFTDTISDILKNNKNTCFLAIGPNNKEKYWTKLIKQYPNRVKTIGLINNSEVEKYIKIADLGIDSFPFSSFTSLLDIGKYNIPCFCLKTPINEIDTFLESGIYYNSQQEMTEAINNFLQKDIVNQNFYNTIKEKHFPEPFIENIKYLYQNTPQTHNIKKLNKSNDDNEFKYWKEFVFKMKMQSKLTFKKNMLQKFCNSIKKRIKKLKLCIK